MNKDQKQAFKRLLADNSASMRWLDPIFDNKEQRAWLNQYREFLRKSYTDTDFAGVADANQRTPMALTKIYVAEQFSKQNLSADDATAEELDDESGLDLEDLLIEFNSDNTPTAVNGRAIIIGAPGSGKSTLIKLLAVACADEGRVSHARHLGRRLVIPFILRELDLKNIANTDDLLQLWAQRVNKQSAGKAQINLQHLRFYLEKGWGIIAFDGVDEVGIKYRRRVRRLVYAFAGRYNKCALLVTGRPVGFENLSFSGPSKTSAQRILQLENKNSNNISITFNYGRIASSHGGLFDQEFLPYYYIRPFSQHQIEQYITHWYNNRYPHDHVKRQTEITELLTNLEKHSNLASIKRRPIYLASLTYIHDVKGRLPNSQVLAYQTMVEAYLDVLDTAKRFHETQFPEEVSKDLNAEDKTLVLEWLAHDLHNKQTGEPVNKDSPFNLRISAEGFDSWLADKLSNDLQQTSIEKEDISAIRRYFISRSGLLVEPEQGVLSFSHLSFQEYLAGAWIYRQMGNHQFGLIPFFKKELLDKVLVNSGHPIGIAFFGIHTRAQQGDFQEGLLDQTWLETPQDPIAEFRFIYKLITEGEYRFSTNFLAKLWQHYWQIAIKDLSVDWVENFFLACQNANPWFNNALPWLKERFFQLTGKDSQEITLYSILPQETMKVLWQEADKTGQIAKMIEVMDEELKWGLDCHALYTEVRTALLAHFSLAELILYGESGRAILPLAYLQENTISQQAYHLFLAAESLLFFTEQDLDLDLEWYRIRAGARERAGDRARVLNWALALALTLARTQDLSLKIDRLITKWLIIFTSIRMTPIFLITPQQACKQLEQFAQTNAEFKALFTEKWFPYLGLKQMAKKPYQPEPIEALSHRLYQQLIQELQKAGEDISDLPEQLKLKPGAAMRKWHGDAAADKYLDDLKAAGWDVETQVWPPEK
jgi:energy-coupling factor transporter ATP-binding protein EcfA2